LLKVKNWLPLSLNCQEWAAEGAVAAFTIQVLPIMDKEMRVSSVATNRARVFCTSLGIDIEANLFIVAVGVSAIAEVFKLQPEMLELDAVFFEDLKPRFLREVDGVEMVLYIEKIVGRFMEPKSTHLLTQIYQISVGEWLMRLVESKWVS
jgi:hypothetical protein